MDHLHPERGLDPLTDHRLGGPCAVALSAPTVQLYLPVCHFDYTPLSVLGKRACTNSCGVKTQSSHWHEVKRVHGRFIPLNIGFSRIGWIRVLEVCSAKTVGKTAALGNFTQGTAKLRRAGVTGPRRGF